VTVGFDHASHHTGDVTGLGVIGRNFGGGSRDRGDRIIGIIINSSLLLGLAVSRPVLGGNGAWARLSGSLNLSSAGGDSRGGRRTSFVVGTLVTGSLGSELRDSRTRELVGAIVEDVDEDTGVVILVGTRESDEFIGAGGSGLVTANVDLDAAGVELGTSGSVSQMKGDDLVTEEISTTSEIGRKTERMGLSIELIFLDPSTVALSGFSDLEPPSVRGVELVA